MRKRCFIGEWDQRQCVWQTELPYVLVLPECLWSSQERVAGFAGHSASIPCHRWAQHKPTPQPLSLHALNPKSVLRSCPNWAYQAPDSKEWLPLCIVVSVAPLKGRSDRHRIPILCTHACQSYHFSQRLPTHSSYSCCSPGIITLIKSPNAKAIEIWKKGPISAGMLSNFCFQYNLLK